MTHARSQLFEISAVVLPSCASCLITQKSAKAKKAAHERFTVTQADLSQMIARALVSETKRAVSRAMMRYTDRVD